MRCTRKGLGKKIAGLIISSLLVILIFSILMLPGTTAIDITLDSGIISLENTTVYEGSLVNFTDISFTVAYEEIDFIDQLNFSIFNNETDAYVAHVTYTVDGIIIQDDVYGNFSILNTTVTGGEEVIHPAHGYDPETITNNDLSYFYDISYKTLELGTFYAKLILYSTEETFNSNKSTTFTVTAPDEFLFDVDLELTLPSVYVGENNTAIIDLMNVGAEGLVNATITRTLYYGDIIIWSTVENVTVSGKTSFSASIPTDGYEPGEYRYEVIHQYGDGQSASASQTFLVKEKLQPEPEPGDDFPYMILIVIVVIILIVLILVFFYSKGILFFVGEKEIEYLIIYEQDDPVKAQLLQQFLFGTQTQQGSINDNSQSGGILKDMAYENPKDGVLLFEIEEEMETILSFIMENGAKYYSGAFMVNNKDMQDENSYEKKVDLLL